LILGTSTCSFPCYQNCKKNGCKSLIQTLCQINKQFLRRRYPCPTNTLAAQLAAVVNLATFTLVTTVTFVVAGINMAVAAGQVSPLPAQAAALLVAGAWTDGSVMVLNFTVHI
jgi:hypothetical protein